MRTLLIISGKGGTGKTTISSAFIKANEIRAFADCDVEAPNLYLVTYPSLKNTTKEYCGGYKATIDTAKCIKCGECKDNCRFSAITNFIVDEYKCEGCGLCEALCRINAIKLNKDVSGFITIREEGERFVYGSLKCGRGNSGKLVSTVKKELGKLTTIIDTVVIDGPPGLGCPVISAFAGVDLALIVSEEGKSGFSDMCRMIETCKLNQVECCVLLNKVSDNKSPFITEVKEYCEKRKVPYVGQLLYNSAIVKANNEANSIINFDEEMKKSMIEVFDKVKNILYRRSL